MTLHQVILVGAAYSSGLYQYRVQARSSGGVCLSYHTPCRTSANVRRCILSAEPSAVQGRQDEVGRSRLLAGLVDEAEGVDAKAIHVTVVLRDAHIIQQKGELHKARPARIALELAKVGYNNE